MESWQFIQSPAGEWYWLCSNVISRQTRTSASTFKTRMECVANAMVSGYQKVAPHIGQMSSPMSGGQTSGQAGAGNVAPQKQHHKGGPPAAGGQQPAKRAQRRNRNRSGKRAKSN